MGECFIVNNIELQQGDCLDLLKVISDNSVDLVLTEKKKGGRI